MINSLNDQQLNDQQLNLNYNSKMQMLHTASESSPQMTIKDVNTELLNQQQYYINAISNQNRLIAELEDYMRKIEMALRDEKAQLADLHQKSEESENDLQVLSMEVREHIKNYSILMESIGEEENQHNSHFRTAESHLNKVKQEYQQKLMEQLKINNAIREMEEHREILKAKFANLRRFGSDLLEETNLVLQENQQIDEFIEESFLMKKRLNNQLQQLRGNIRVYCRIRPLLLHEEDQEEPIIELVNNNTLKLKVPKQSHKSENHQKDYSYNFEQIFNMQENQVQVFNELSQLIQSAVDGKNVCIFAYGQTGSGKTYTMQGGESESQKGIIPRSVQLIFSEIQKSRKYEWEHEVNVSIQEVYLDNVRDLLKQKYESNETVNKMAVSSPMDIYCLLEEAGRNRKVAETSCNEHSSRSHLIFTIHLIAKHSGKKLQRRGSLNLVDLAGSERVSLSKVEGDRMKETQAINKSLTQLGVVITALAKKQTHVPFRNSKLTYLLQKYLEGDSKTLMLVNISPKSSDFNQTLCSLRFAEMVKECKLKK